MPSAIPHLNDLGYQRQAPQWALRPYIRWYWCMQAQAGSYLPRQEFMHPEGRASLIFNWQDGFALNQQPLPSGLYVERAVISTRSVALQGAINCFGVVFQAGANFQLSGIPGSEWEAHRLAGLFRQSCDWGFVEEALACAGSFAERCTLVDSVFLSVLAKRSNRGRDHHPLILAAIDHIQQQPGLLSIEELALKLAVNRRQLERQFKQHLGLSPKQYARTLRVAKARRYLKAYANSASQGKEASARGISSPRVAHAPQTLALNSALLADDIEGQQESTLADLSLELGYFDQAHFIRDFKSVMLLTPGAYLAKLRQRQILSGNY